MSLASFHPLILAQGWKRLISSPLTTQGRISLVADILSNRGEVEVARHLCGDDAQAFVDAVYEACSPRSSVSEE